MSVKDAELIRKNLCEKINDGKLSSGKLDVGERGFKVELSLKSVTDMDEFSSYLFRMTCEEKNDDEIKEFLYSVLETLTGQKQ